MPRRRPRAGEKRMDAAIDHFAEMGYRKADVRRVVNKLLKDVYGKDGWPLLEDSCYSVVQEALFELEEQEKLQQQQNEDDDGDDEGEEAHLEPQQEEVEEEAPQEVAIKEEPSEEFVPIAMVVPPSEAVVAVEQTEEAEKAPLLIDPPSPRAASPDPLATGTKRKRPPCYGWISESESDSDYEEYVARRQQRVQVPAK
ncbi:uncharacterized protein LOC125523881 isoform X2 [Triticum urartu]|uniref:uncharacterized protein LOC119332111 isoform X2 n=1 Tax=Triticum dicoccoides TaxID=85692 RepID=UPI0018918F83|nr:uncharacterized protein LOC119332111 isoform X2 [Triticum dicoccoides]XP_044425042.1 uncharacterized protein LOC123149453 isoform X2 [Triticum aestivum]XP_048544899.1 uncharacterized protein LOC125523881 isoform X2 [Triticum urartu]